MNAANSPLRPRVRAIIKRYWLQRLPEILVTLKDLPDKVIDRPTFETIFRLRRRRAIELMHSLGSCRGGRGYVLDRCMLVQRLESMNVFAQYRWEEQVRAERVIQQLNGSKAKSPNGSNGSHDHTMRIVLEFADEGELTQSFLNLLHAACDGSGHSADVITTKRESPVWPFRAGDQSLLETELPRSERVVLPKPRFGRTGESEPVAETSLRTCKRRMEMPFTSESFDVRYTYGITLLNDRRLSEAREEFESALRINPGVDYVYYALAACFALCGDMPNLYCQSQPCDRVAASQQGCGSIRPGFPIGT